MGWGGKRTGAGRKPSKGIVLGLDGTRQVPKSSRELPPALPQEAKEGLQAAPYYLPEGARGYWERWAPQALEERTLTPSTAAGFAELCKRAAYVQQLDAKIAHLGPDTQEALQYLGLYDRMSKGLTAALKDFKLNGFGKPATSDKPKAAANPWAAMS